MKACSLLLGHNVYMVTAPVWSSYWIVSWNYNSQETLHKCAYVKITRKQLFPFPLLSIRETEDAHLHHRENQYEMNGVELSTKKYSFKALNRCFWYTRNLFFKINCVCTIHFVFTGGIIQKVDPRHFVPEVENPNGALVVLKCIYNNILNNWQFAAVYTSLCQMSKMALQVGDALGHLNGLKWKREPAGNLDWSSYIFPSLLLLWEHMKLKLNWILILDFQIHWVFKTFLLLKIGKWNNQPAALCWIKRVFLPFKILYSSSKKYDLQRTCTAHPKFLAVNYTIIHSNCIFCTTKSNNLVITTSQIVYIVFSKPTFFSQKRKKILNARR